MPQDTKSKLISENTIEIKDLIFNPVLIKNNIDIIEKVLHQLILEGIESFLEC